jgi:hypothetical protein
MMPHPSIGLIGLIGLIRQTRPIRRRQAAFRPLGANLFSLRSAPRRSAIARVARPGADPGRDSV